MATTFVELSVLFSNVAPQYSAKPMISHLREKFNAISEQEFSLRVGECIKFLYLRSVSGRGFIPLAGEVDDIWHEFILQTREYARFCQMLPGKCFIHHNSVAFDTHADKISNQQAVKNLLEWIPAYVKAFGDFTQITASYWVIVKLLQCEFDYSLEQINQLSG
jgi:hypothetical protein